MYSRALIVSLLLHCGFGVYAMRRITAPELASMVAAAGDDDARIELRFRTEAPTLPAPSVEPEPAPAPEPAREPATEPPTGEPAAEPEPTAPAAAPPASPDEPPPAAIEPPAPPSTATSAVIAPRPGHNPPPEYPAAARRRGCCGTVLLLVEVDDQGAAVAVSLQQSCGHRVLDDAALRAVRQWRFAGGPGRVLVPVEFVLRR